MLALLDQQVDTHLCSMHQQIQRAIEDVKGKKLKFKRPHKAVDVGWMEYC